MFLANRKKKQPAIENPTAKREGGKTEELKKTGEKKAEATRDTDTPPNPENQTGWSWEHSWAKEILREAYVNNDITDQHTYDEIHAWHPEVQATDRKALPRRFRDLKAQIKADQGSAQEDARALAHDRKLFPTPEVNHAGEPRWEGSESQRLLRLDVKEGKHLTMKPEGFYVSRPEYQIYSASVIRSHIYQEIKLTKYYTWRREKPRKAFRVFK